MVYECEVRVEERSAVMGDDCTIYPNGMSLSETKRLIAEGTLEPSIDRGLAIAAVRSGVPLSLGGKLANLLMIGAPILGLILALVWGWWWVLIGIAAGIGNFRIARAECVKAVCSAAMSNDRLFTALRDRGVISFRFRN